MNFNKGDAVVTNLLNQVSDHFPKIQSAALFPHIGLEIQMRIARKRLNDLMVQRQTSNREAINKVTITEDIRNALLFNHDSGLGYFFRDIFPKISQ